MLKLVCAATLIVNLTKYPINDRDKSVIKRAKYVCSSDSRYTDTPCLKRFIKKGKLSYMAICGKGK